jgi:putative transcriptional regulator
VLIFSLLGLFIFVQMRTNKQIYNRLKACLALKRVRNKELAEHLNVTPQTVSKWCTNYSQPSIPELYRIAHFLKIDIMDLLEPLNSVYGEYEI